jgi:pyridoxine 5-phosphate synthase
MARLQVNVDHVATLREARRVGYPDPVVAAAMAEMAGADGITVHLRGDRRHIKERDLELLRQTVQTRLNIEMAATPEMVKIAQQIKPHQVTLVPERPDELTTEGGLDVIRARDAVQKAVSRLKEGDMQVSLFIDPDVEQIKAAHKLDVDTVELNTGRYCDAKFQVDRFHAYNNLVNAAKAAAKLNLVVAAGHGLHYHNVKDLHGISEIEEYNIGFSIVARAVLVGFDRAVREMVALLK